MFLHVTYTYISYIIYITITNIRYNAYKERNVGKRNDKSLFRAILSMTNISYLLFGERRRIANFYANSSSELQRSLMS